MTTEERARRSYQKYPWDLIEKYFIESGPESNVSLLTVSKRYAIPYGVVRHYAGRHKWYDRRYQAFLERNQLAE